MMWTRFFAISILACFGVTGCASKLVIRSEPSEAVVNFIVPDTNEKKSIGITPLELTSDQISDFTRFAATQGDFLEFVVEKEGFQPQSMLVPYTRMFSRITDIQIRLLVKEKTGKVYHSLVQHLVNAQTFIHRLELERAEAECQRALKLDSEFAFAHLLLAHTKFLRRDYVQSLRQYERVLELDPSNREALRMIAEVRKLAPRVPAGKGGGTR